MASDDPLTLGRYRLEAKLATGGMGEVFLARMQGSAGFEKKVVIKRILPHLAQSPEFVERFLDEGRLVVQLSHGNIVQVLDMGNVDNHYYLAMEYVDGLDLRALLGSLKETRSLLPVPFAAHIAAEVAKGLAYAHGRVGDDGRNLGIIHRDVSPSNVMVSREGEVKLLDFGIAKAAGRMTHSVSGSLHGKFLYMSPEQAAGRSLDQRSDLFSLGTLFYEMLTGRRPFEGESEMRTLDLIRTGGHEAPRARRAEIPPEVEAIVERCLAVDRDRRYTTADEVHRDVLGWLVDSRAVVSHAALADVVLPHLRPRPTAATPLDLDAAINRELEALLGAGPKAPAAGTLLAAAKVDTPLAHGETAPRATPISHLSARVDTSTTARARLAAMPETDVPKASRNRILIASVVLLVGVLVTLNLVTLDELRKRPASEADAAPAPAALTASPDRADAAALVAGPATPPPVPAPVAAAPDGGAPDAGEAPDVAAVAIVDAGADPGAAVAAIPDAGPAMWVRLAGLPDGAEVSIAGAVATADAEGRYPVPPGDGPVPVVVVAAGRERFESSVDRAAGVVAIEAKLEAARRMVQVDVEPEDAEIAIGGRVLGKGSARVPVSPDAPVHGKAQLEGFEAKSFTLKYSGPRLVSLTLKPKAFGYYELRIFPADAPIVVDGRSVGKHGNHVKGQVTAGVRHQIVLGTGSSQKTLSFTVAAGETYRAGTITLGE